MLTKDEKYKVWEMIKDARTAMFTSWNGEFLAARPMAHANNEFEGTLYYFTDLTSDKIDELIKFPEVNLSYKEGSDELYISLSGHVTISRDKALMEKLWNPYVSAWFPDGLQSPNLGLLCVQVEKGEYWDAQENIMVELFRIAKANITNEEPQLGENEKVG